MPLHDSQAFDQWLLDRWAEKEKLLKHFQSYGRFPTDEAYIQADIELHKSMEILQVFTCLFAVLAAWWTLIYVRRGIVSLYIAAI